MEAANEGHRGALLKGDRDPSPSDFDRHNQHQAEKSSCTKSKKSSGLKRIAKQVIDIIKLRQRMTYPQVAYIVVQMNLKKEDAVGDSGMLPPKVLDDEDDSEKEEDVDIPDSALWDESNLATSAKKQKKKKGAMTTEGGDDEEDNNETPARRRSRQESNLRRRIYDAWNVLKAASIIVE